MERVPGDPLTVRADLRVGDEPIGVLIAACRRPGRGSAPTRRCFELYASEIGVAIRNAELFAQVEDQNAQLRQLDEARTTSCAASATTSRRR